MTNIEVKVSKSSMKKGSEKNLVQNPYVFSEDIHFWWGADSLV